MPPKKRTAARAPKKPDRDLPSDTDDDAVPLATLPKSKRGAGDVDGDGDVEENDEAADDASDVDELPLSADETNALEEQIIADDVTKEKMEQREPPSILVLPLLSYQKQFLAWALKQELGPLRGGILADEMGMGKTLQAVSVIVTHPSEGCVLEGSSGEDADSSRDASATNSLRSQAVKIARLKPRTDTQAQEAEQTAAQPSESAGEACERDASATPDVAKLPEESTPVKRTTRARSAGHATRTNANARSEGKENVLANHTSADKAVAPDIADGKDGKSPAADAKEGKSPAGRKKGKRADPMALAATQAKDCHVEEESGGMGQFCNATLVVCPVVAAGQWKQEILRYTRPGSMNVVLFHGNKRGVEFTREQLEAADVVLTTYSVLEVDYRTALMAPKATCKYCLKKFQPERLKVHLRYFCGPFASKTEAQAKQMKKKAPWMVADGKKSTSKVKSGKVTKTTVKAGAKSSPAKASKSAGSKGGPPAKKARVLRSGSEVSKSKGKAKAGAKTKGRASTGKGAAKAAAKPASVGQKRKRGRRGGDDLDEEDENDSDWSPDSEASAQLAVDDQDDDEESMDATSEEGDSEGGPEGGREGKDGEDEDENDEEDEEEDKAELDKRVKEAADRMIADAQKARDKKAQRTSLLHEVRWRRVVLDEAHNIKDRRCNTAQAAFALVARYRWCLSGTPLQNRVTELYSLVRFLRVFPYSHYFADKTGCSSLDFPFKNDLRKCDLCDGSRMSHYCWWNRRIANPIKYHGYEGRGRTALLILKHQILPQLLLRRTKVQCSEDLALPPRRLVLRKDPFDAREADFYEALYTQSQAAFSGYVDTGTVLNNYAHIFDLLIRLRQAVNHPYLVVYSASGGKNDSIAGGGSTKDSTKDSDTADALLGVCGLCHDPLEDGVAAACGHAFCRLCVTDYLATCTSACRCPVCQRPLTIDLAAANSAETELENGKKARKNGKAGGSRSCVDSVTRNMRKYKKSSIINRINVEQFQSSTKLEALLEEIIRMREVDESAKCIVFSQFTSMLDLAQFRLQQLAVKCVKLEGSMSLDLRNAMIKSFNEDPGVTCFLMSLKAGGVALNLTVASHVMLMDPWWNPAVEQQAQDRIHRLGQFKPITVTRFVIAGTIEERILKLQEKKQLIFEGTVGRDTEALGKLTVDDLRFLFG